MTKFETARRHKASTAPAPKLVSAPLQKTTSLDSATSRLHHGLQSLQRIGANLGLQTSVSLFDISRVETPLPPPPAGEEPGPQADEEDSLLEEERVNEERKKCEDELTRYLDEGLYKRLGGLRDGLDQLAYWESNEFRYPNLFSIAMDILPVQASAVPCERVFSSGKETCALRRNRISPALMEALQVLKFTFKKQRLDFTMEPLAREEDYSIEGPVTVAASDELVREGQYEVLGELWANEMEFLETRGNISSQ